MREIVYNGNIFEEAKILDPYEEKTIVITTNGVVKNNGQAVMGRGIAKYAADNLVLKDFPELDSLYPDPSLLPDMGIQNILGKLLTEKGNHAYFLGYWYDKETKATFGIITMPTKNHWKDPSDLNLIKRSCEEMMTLATVNNLYNVYLPAPGCSNGWLSWDDVYKVINPILDDRFHCVHPDTLKRQQEIIPKTPTKKIRTTIYEWIPVNEEPFPEKEGVYRCTLQNGEIYNARYSIYGNGPFWEFSKRTEAEFRAKGLGEPEVIAWFPNPEPYREKNKDVNANRKIEVQEEQDNEMELE